MNKAEILAVVTEKLNVKIKTLENLIAETRASNNETKSSMGDKYETSREMVQQEINNLQLQLNGNVHAKNSLKLIAVSKSDKVGLGSLVEISSRMFYIAVSLGNVIFNSTKIFVISPESPLSKTIFDLKKGEEFSLNNVTQVIKEIW